MYQLLVGIQLICIVAVLLLTIVLFTQLGNRKQGLVLLMILFEGINAFGYFLEITNPGRDTAFIGTTVAYLGKVMLLYVTMQFVLELNEMKLGYALKTVMMGIAIAVFMLVLFSKYTSLYYTSIDFTEEGVIPHLILGHGVVYFLYTVYLFSCFGIMVGICIYGILKSNDELRKKQDKYMLAATIVQISGFLVFMTKLTSGYDTTALGSIGSVFIMTYASVRYGWADTLSAAKDEALRVIDDGIIVLDEKNRLLYYNTVAADIYSYLPSWGPEPLTGLVSEIHDVMKGGGYKGFKDKVFQVGMTDMESSGFYTGKLYVFSDVTETYRRARSLAEEVKGKNKLISSMEDEREQFTLQVVLALSKAVEMKDPYTNGHSQRVADYACMIAEKMGYDETRLTELRYAGLLHDIGKIQIPDGILNKAGRLDDNEYMSIKNHCMAGYHILSHVNAYYDVSTGARWHHERFDGRGYPDGLSGEEIPLNARILCVADAYDAMTSTRIYRKAMSQEVVREEIAKGRGAQFDPDVADIMLELIDADKEYRMRQLDMDEEEA